MPKLIIWSDELAAEYKQLFDTCIVKASITGSIDRILAYMVKNKDRYAAIAHAANPDMPWWFIATVHHMECNGDFNKHLHNGDSLRARTIHIPSGRPLTGNPPFTFEQSAADALHLTGADKLHDWRIEKVLYVLEGYNGYGYRQYHPTVLSPYLWSMTNHYSKGKYVSDGRFDANAISMQIGIAAILKRLLVPVADDVA